MIRLWEDPTLIDWGKGLNSNFKKMILEYFVVIWDQVI